MAARFGQHAFQFDLEAVPVVEAGERVALGQVKQLFGGLAFAGDVFVDPQMADEAAIAIAHRVAQLGDDAAIAHDDFMAVGIDLLAQHMRDVVPIFIGLGQFAGAAREDHIGALADQVGVLRAAARCG